MSDLTQSNVWRALEAQRKTLDGLHMRDLFAADPDRFERFSLQTCGILLDYSKNRVTAETLNRLFELAQQADVEGWRRRLFNGEHINLTEDRPALHPALRNRSSQPFMVDGEDVMPAIKAVLDKMRTFTDAIRDGSRTGATGKTITDVVNIGIGGSDLGPKMVTQALEAYCHDGLKLHFVSNVDSAHITQVLNSVSWETTIFIVSSKTFTTQETMLNAGFARDWLMTKSGRDDVVGDHFFASTTNPAEARKFGISAEGIFEFWDWVGGRYSLWSSVGLTIAIGLGMDGFEDLLHGAYDMDEHFRNAPLERNMPVILALLGIWYINFYGIQSHAIVPYDQNLGEFADYFQQGDMESNGKSVTRDGRSVDYATAPVIWGKPGTNGQHSFFQRLHQGTGFVPTDFIAAAEPTVDSDSNHQLVHEHHTVLLANFLAQAQALMRGNSEEEVRESLVAGGMDADAIDSLLPHKVVPGNRPSNALVCRRMDPKTLGALIALYEHKIFVQGIVWRINSFDQWGVELGKQLANALLPDLKSDAPASNHDASTNGLINYLKNLQD